MPENLAAYEPAIRLGASLGLFALLAFSELVAPRRGLEAPKAKRWLTNLGLTVGNTMLVRLLFIILGVTSVGVAVIVQSNGWGLLNQGALPALPAAIAGFLALDAIIYAQHVVMHRYGPLWRLHRVHHADTDIDVTTGLRFHPLEIILSMAIKIAAILALGPSPAAVLAFEVVLNATSMFNHANIRLPLGLDKWLRLVVVTPDMHRVHHSIIASEYNRNFGFNLPWWDRMFGTYQAQPVKGHAEMTIGLPQYRDPHWRGIGAALTIPFRNDEAGEGQA